MNAKTPAARGAFLLATKRHDTRIRGVPLLRYRTSTVFNFYTAGLTPSQDFRSHEHQTNRISTMAVSATLSFLMEQFDKRVADKPTREKFYHDVMEFSYHQPFTAVETVHSLFQGQPADPFTATIATVVWLCACASFLCARWFMQLISGASPGARQRAIKGSNKKKEERILWEKLAAVKRPERNPQENTPPYRETTAIKSPDTADESGSDSGGGKGNGQNVLTPPGGAAQSPLLQAMGESEKLRRDIERSLR
ncbi:unnamed protein product [Tuber aestivum]|uniref:Uncharacterized protein n=1 Tax=Tuber aestivum TaxID=59557 RepID=A0A292PUX7_9PEZI|nr:unnamed protein product [Tuber aestivum]